MSKQEFIDVAGERHKSKQRAKAADNPIDKRPAIERLYSAWTDLKNQGWRDIIYAPKDGTEIEVIECGSVGIHSAMWVSFGHTPLDSCGSFFIDGDWPSDPILWRPKRIAKDRLK